MAAKQIVWYDGKHASRATNLGGNQIYVYPCNEGGFGITFLGDEITGSWPNREAAKQRAQEYLNEHVKQLTEQ